MRQWTWAAMLVAGCSGTTPSDSTSDSGWVDDWQPVSYVDEGTVCFLEGATGVEVQVVVNDCLSSSCSRDLVAVCSATVSGAAITLTSDISWEENVGEGVPCTDDCGFPLATCAIEGLADGSYTVTFGAQTLDLTVPVATTACPLR